MTSTTWRKRFAVWRSRLYLYPPPEPMPRTGVFWIAMGLVALLAVAFSAFFIAFLTSRHNAYLTGAEDMGIMDQAVWGILHGQPLHMTICNIVSDTNCYSSAGVSRFAIHFEPILFPISLLYIFWPGPNTLVIFQTLVVASGAFPAFWLARLRLRSNLAAVPFALVYLLYPAQQQATIFEFHAVALTAALLLFALYFMYTRKTVWLFVFAILTMACKEELPAVIALLGLWMILFQQRWRAGLGLVVLAFGWLGMTLLSYHFFSPTGHPLLVSRYSYLGSSPVQIVLHVLRHPISMFKQHVWEIRHRAYLELLLAPAGYLPLLAPWVLVLAVPSLALNLFSSDPNQYVGVFQYSAEIVPILIFATIEAIVFIIWLVQWYINYVQEMRPKIQAPETVVARINPTPSWRLSRWLHPVLLSVLIIFALVSVVSQDFTYGSLPFSQGFKWPQITDHDKLAQRLINMIPSSASVSAQSNLVPHISERSHIYMFPYQDNAADYIFLDVTNNTYPLYSDQYNTDVNNILLGGNYGVVAAQDGYLLLKRGLPSPGIAPYSPAQSGPNVIPNLPASFCSFVRVPQQQVTNPLRVDFTATGGSDESLSLVGYSFSPPDSFTANANTRYMQVNTYWRVNTPVLPDLRVQVRLANQSNKEEYSSTDFPALTWCPTSTWKPGTIISAASRILYIGGLPTGLAHVSIALLPLTVPLGTIAAQQDRLPLRIVSAPDTVVPAPGTNAVQVATFTIT
ncbi:MAG TPA: DUF2079 domain-containing protein [Ktedonobacteraceae bacterium]|nr:DUF2079 domain-containing protein [Ktedonobacteraceae bacterium]